MTVEHHDMLIVGAGLSGIGVACHLRRSCPQKSFAVLEARAASGGTWDLFRYPGIRSDSDMFTLGYAFKPWTKDKAIADGEDIRSYIREAAQEYGVEPHIRYRTRVVSADWSSATNRWSLQVQRGDNDKLVTMTSSFVFLCTGYYRYDEGYTPNFSGREDFRGQVIHPQHWPEDLDVTGKRIVVIGSGATAMTLVPSLAKRAAHVTMLQRSPTYVVSRPEGEKLANLLRAVLPEKAVYRAVRAKNILLSSFFYRLSRRRPEYVKKRILDAIRAELPGFDVDRHFTPSYNPWDQRVCLVPESDLFASIRSGTVDVVTDHIERFTAEGVLLKSGATLPADILVTATGLKLQLHGGMDLSLDGQAIRTGDLMSYKSMMLCGVPNMAFAIGYTNASWTLKLDLVADNVCQIINYMNEKGYERCVPALPDESVKPEPPMDLKAGYVLRDIDTFPKQGDRAPWQVHQNYLRDLRLLRFGDLDRRYLQFGRGPGELQQPAASKIPAAS